MKHWKTRLWILACVLLVSSALIAGVAISGETDNDEKTAVTFEQLPEAVAGVFALFAEAGEVSEYVREDEGEDVNFTAQVSIDGGAFELKLDSQGQVLEVEVDGAEDTGDDELDDDGPGGDGDGEEDDD